MSRWWNRWDSESKNTTIGNSELVELVRHAWKARDILLIDTPTLFVARKGDELIIYWKKN